MKKKLQIKKIDLSKCISVNNFRCSHLFYKQVIYIADVVNFMLLYSILF